MSAASQAVGRYGERVACAHLESAGLRVLARNWRCRWGELDVVAVEGDVVVAVEVKTRRTGAAGTPAEAVTPEKVARLRRLLRLWLAEQGSGPRGADLRVDVVGVVPQPSGPARVQHLRAVG